MKINSIQNQNTRQSFGMAKLTEKGTDLAKQFISTMPKYQDETSYLKKNFLAKQLSQIQAGKLEPEYLDKFFKKGTTEYAFVNDIFIKKQITTLRGQDSIKKFLQNNSTEGKLNDTGSKLADNIVDVFDMNASNELIRPKTSLKMLNLVKDYLGTDALAKRIALMSDEIFSK